MAGTWLFELASPIFSPGAVVHAEEVAEEVGLSGFAVFAEALGLGEFGVEVVEEGGAVGAE